MNGKMFAAMAVAALLSWPGNGAVGKAKPGATGAEIWRDPADITSRDLYYGPGGKRNAPHGGFVFVKEDREGSNPKFIVEDAGGVKWKVKLGPEAQSETTATRLTWAVGYFTDEDYLLPYVRILEMPVKLHRGQNLISPDGRMRNARFERNIPGVEKLDKWRWRDNTFYGSREFNGLRVMMALLNNWDLKDANNAVYADKHTEGKRTYTVADLGASFGAPGFAHPSYKSRNNIQTYSQSKFIRRVTPEYVDFSAPARPAIVRWVDPFDYVKRLRIEWIGRRIPREDAKWMGRLLGRLSRRQIADAFRAGGYSPGDIEAFTSVVQSRIAELNAL